jgi:hypothetical protein
MKKKTQSSASRNKSPRRRKIPERLSRKAPAYEIKYMNYEQAKDFSHQFIDSMLNTFQEQASPFEMERFHTATREIIMEVIKDKYQLPMFEASVLLMHAGIELLETIDANLEKP